MSKSLLIKKVYNEGYARTKAVEYDFRLQKVFEIIKHFNLGDLCKMLDIGCGDGFLTKELAKRLDIKEVYGIDISKKAIGKTLQNNIKVKIMDIDQEDLPFENDFFDFIFCGNLIELVLDSDHLLVELWRVLSPKGFLIVTFPNLCAWASRIAVILGFHPYYDRISRYYDLGKLFLPLKRGDSTGNIHLYTLRSFTHLAQLYGLKVTMISGAGEVSLPKIMRFVDKLFSRITPLAFQLICVLKKDKPKI